MPGIVTHNKIFQESIKLLSIRKKRTFLSKSIESLMSDEKHLKAGLFGAIGPNIFDFIPKIKKRNQYGSEISFLIHNGGSRNLIPVMIDKILNYKDRNNEWSAIQRAYLYGYISHIITDSIFHPFSFFWSGFPDEFTKKQIRYYREQNLMFSYNMDNYYLYNKDEKESDFNFNLKDMLPVLKKGKFYHIYPEIKDIILRSLDDTYPELFQKLSIRECKEDDFKYSKSLSYLDVIPFFIEKSYAVKFSKNKKLIDIINYIKRKNIIYSDFLVRYPKEKRVDDHLLNFHKDRWQYPAGKTELQYLSVKNLFDESCEQTILVWEKIESLLWGSSVDLSKEFEFNVFTGTKELNYYDMKNKEPQKIRY